MNKFYILLPLALLIQSHFLEAQNIGINVDDPQALLHVQAQHRSVINESFEEEDHDPIISEGAWIKLGGAYSGDQAYQTDYLPHGESKSLILDIVVPELGFDFSGVNAPKTKRDHYTVAYSTFTVPLVKAVQELAIENEKLKNELETNKHEMEKMKADLEKISAWIQANNQ